MKTLISVEEARTIILDVVARGPEERIALEDALGRTLAEPLISRDNIPPFNNSAMDGYAVRAEDLATPPATLRIIEDIPAGRFPQQTVATGTCARIMTGAPFPEGADAVVPVEWTAGDDGEIVYVNRAPAIGQHVRQAGKDVQRGERVLEGGEIITPPVVGMLATLGYPTLTVAKQPRLAVISTGDELVDAAASLAPGQIRDGNGPALAAQARTAGAAVLPAFRARDTKASIRTVIEDALAADVLVFSGGVSVGEYDFVKQVLDEMGMDLAFWKVRQRPGKPLAFGTLKGRLVFGLPGNPVSSSMCFEQYVRPALAKMLGRRTVLRPRHPAVLDAPTPKVPGLHFFTRGFAFFGADGTLRVRDTGPQGSNLYTSVVRANCIIHLPEAMEAAEEGMGVYIEWLQW